MWRDSSKAPLAAEALKLTAQDLLELKVIDKIIKEPLGGAHRNPAEQAQILKKEVLKALEELQALTPPELIERRIQKFRGMGIHYQIEEKE